MENFIWYEIQINLILTSSPLAKAATPLLKLHECQKLIPDPSYKQFPTPLTSRIFENIGQNPHRSSAEISKIPWP